MNARNSYFPVYLTRDADAEAAWLGLALMGIVDPQALNTSGFVPFFEKRHNALWQAMIRLRYDGQPAELSAVGPWLAEHDQLAEAGGAEYLQWLVEKAQEVPDDPPEEPVTEGAEPEPAAEGAQRLNLGPRALTALLKRYAVRRQVIHLGLAVHRYGIRREPIERFPIEEMRGLVEYYAGTPAPQTPAPALAAPPTAFSAPELSGRAPEDGGGWLVERLLVRGGVNLLAGEVAGGKTFLALDLALAVAAGLPAWDGRPALHGPVLYYCLDSGPRTLQERLNGLCLGRQMPPPAGLRFDFAPLNLALPADTALVAAAIRKQKAVLVIFDVLARYMPGVDENSVASVGPVMTALRTLATSSGCSLLLLHHFNKGGYASNASSGLRVRGSTDIYGAVDAALTVTLRSRGPGGAGMRRLLTPEKNRQAPEEPRMEFAIVPGGDSALRLEFGVPRASAAGAGLDYQPYLEALLEALAAAGRALTREELVAVVGGRLPSSEYVLNQVFQKLAQVPDMTLSRRGRFRTFAMGEMNNNDNVA